LWICSIKCHHQHPFLLYFVEFQNNKNILLRLNAKRFKINTNPLYYKFAIIVFLLYGRSASIKEFHFHPLPLWLNYIQQRPRWIQEGYRSSTGMTQNIPTDKTIGESWLSQGATNYPLSSLSVENFLNRLHPPLSTLPSQHLMIQRGHRSPSLLC
jgi:hypothetical protein